MLVAGALVLPCCLSSPVHRTPPFPEPAAFSTSGAVTPPDRWWTEFRRDDLDTLVETALASELNLKSAWQRFRAAEAVVERESSFLFPELEGFADGLDFESTTANQSQIELGLSAFYEVDLWGRIRSAVDAERFRAEATFADYETIALTLSAEVVRTWVQLMEACARRDLLDRQIQTNQKLERQLQNQFAGGQTRSVDVLRQRQLVAATRQEKAATEASIHVLENRLAVLLGRPSQNGVRYVPQGLPNLPPLPDPGVPVELVRRRPDVRSAFHRLQAANREVAVAISDQFPRLTLSTSVSSSTVGAEELFEDWARSFAANLIAPLLEAGRRRAEVDRTRAVENQLLYDYGQTVLVAFQEVENALVQERKQREQIRRLDEQVRLAKDTYDQLLVEYRNGVSDFIDLLTALTDEQRLRRELLLANRVLLEFRIALYRALAGGFVATFDAEEVEDFPNPGKNHRKSPPDGPPPTARQ